MRDRSVSTVATGREDHIASCHAPSVSAACALPPLPVWLAAPPCPASLLAARFTPSPLSQATLASGERERIGFRKKGENPTREKNEKRKRGKGAGKEKENRGKGNKLFTFYKLCFENYSNQIIIG
jgi:hypothetical protein